MMIKKILFLSLFIFCSVRQVNAQLLVSKQVQLLYNEQKDAFFVLDDSTHYWTQKTGSKVWKKHPFVYKGDLPFQQVMSQTKGISIDQNTYYFVQNGCGPVYALQQDTFKRIDQSFPHRNQYGSSLFFWKDNVFMFGGFGYFEVKSTFIRFVPRAKEWFKVMTHNSKQPQARQKAISISKGGRFYLLGGSSDEGSENSELRDFWVYHCTRKVWEKRGKLHDKLAQTMHGMDLNTSTQGSVYRKSNKLIALDISKNQWFMYENPLVLNMHKLVSSKNNEYLIYGLTQSATNKLEIHIQPFHQLKEFKLGMFQIYHKISVFELLPKEDYLWISMILNFVLFSLIFYIRRMHKFTLFKRAQLNLQQQDFTPTEWEIMCVIQRNGEMELAALNEYFNEGGLSYETLKKRRETFLKNIRIKIALITRKPLEEILVETKHQLDKRMKIIHWNKDIEL